MMRINSSAFAVLLVLSASPVMAQSAGQAPDVGAPPIIATPKIAKTETAGAVLKADKDQYPAGQTINFVFTITNTGKSPVSYTYPTAQQIDFAVADSTGKPIWHWGQNRVFGQSITRLDLKPGQSKSYELTWNQRDDQVHPVPAGTYTVMATTTPSSKPVMTGGGLTNTNPDPTNMGVPEQNRFQSGAIQVKNTTPSLSAKTTIIIEAASP